MDTLVYHWKTNVSKEERLSRERLGSLKLGVRKIPFSAKLSTTLFSSQ